MCRGSTPLPSLYHLQTQHMKLQTAARLLENAMKDNYQLRKDICDAEEDVTYHREMALIASTREESLKQLLPIIFLLGVSLAVTGVQITSALFTNLT